MKNNPRFDRMLRAASLGLKRKQFTSICWCDDSGKPMGGSALVRLSPKECEAYTLSTERNWRPDALFPVVCAEVFERMGCESLITRVKFSNTSARFLAAQLGFKRIEARADSITYRLLKPMMNKQILTMTMPVAREVHFDRTEAFSLTVADVTWEDHGLYGFGDPAALTNPADNYKPGGSISPKVFKNIAGHDYELLIVGDAYYDPKSLGTDISVRALSGSDKIKTLNATITPAITESMVGTTVQITLRLWGEVDTGRGYTPPLEPDSCKRSLFHGGCVNVREGDASSGSRRKRRNRCIGNSGPGWIRISRRGGCIFRCGRNLLSDKCHQFGGSGSVDGDIPVLFVTRKANKIRLQPSSCRKLHSELSQWSLGQFLGYLSRQSKEKKYCEVHLLRRDRSQPFLTSRMGGSHAE